MRQIKITNETSLDHETIKKKLAHIFRKIDAVGICRVCGCTWDNACHHPEHGACWWHNEDQDLCSHCALELTPIKVK